MRGRRNGTGPTVPGQSTRPPRHRSSRLVNACSRRRFREANAVAARQDRRSLVGRPSNAVTIRVLRAHEAFTWRVRVEKGFV